ncbi:endoglucanase 3 [Physcomitrium patens]|uniref:Endoglucanase n=1 Tax=Physcomitrium patens TaxID=3218 RepID=A0A2K1IPD6_PHYPA|nr:endoglucanase 3-like [Physcomitrium patens]PNR31146.1 hypothetical protein PHYPA_027463 [Physcomitrium patens]|eukprot:XP_024361312.1 endoglucanase 3-like [Physcomitrella patens]
MERNGSSRSLKRNILAVVTAVSWANLVAIAVAFNSAEYASALDKSLLFYDVQRSGKLPPWQRIKWRADSALDDGKAEKMNLTGGYYDAGDNVKFGLPMAFSITLLAWNVVEFGDNLQYTGQLQNLLNNIRWGTDYLLRCYSDSEELWVQVGEPNADHQCWERPEDMDTPRTAYKIDSDNPGSDVAAETAAAFAAASMAFRRADVAYSNTLILSARRIFNFADNYRGKYSDSLAGAVCPFYCSYSGYKDELVWGAAWLYKATRLDLYLQYLITNANSLGGATVTVNAFNWDNKYAGAQLLVAQEILTGTQGLQQGYKDRADGYICQVLPSSISPASTTTYTPGGLLYQTDGSNMQAVTTAAFLLTNYARSLATAKKTIQCGGSQITPAQLTTVAQNQVDYILGNNPKKMSYMVGFGSKYPTQPHHRASSLPSTSALSQKIGCGQGFTYYSSKNPNPNLAMGAIVGGPDKNDNFNDVRSNYAALEPTTYINAPIVGILAVLATNRTSTTTTTASAQLPIALQRF